MHISDVGNVFLNLFQYLKQMPKYEKIIQSHVSAAFSHEEEVATCMYGSVCRDPVPHLMSSDKARRQ